MYRILTAIKCICCPGAILPIFTPPPCTHSAKNPLTGEALKDGAVQRWEDIKNTIFGIIQEVIQFFVDMWKAACNYTNKAVDKLKELNPFQEFAEDLGSGAYDVTETVKGWFGYGAPSVTGAHKLPVTAGNKNVSITQNNNYNINAKDSVEGAEKGLKQAQNKFAQPSYIGLVN